MIKRVELHSGTVQRDHEGSGSIWNQPGREEEERKVFQTDGLAQPKAWA